MNIHFIDDDYAINRYHELTLKSHVDTTQTRVSFFDNPAEILINYENEDLIPDLIFLDINMPIIDGWEFLDIFNKKFPDAQTVFIILTTSNNPNHLDRSKQYHNVEDFTIKPLKPEKFRNMTAKFQLAKSCN